MTLICGHQIQTINYAYVFFLSVFKSFKNFWTVLFASFVIADVLLLLCCSLLYWNFAVSSSSARAYVRKRPLAGNIGFTT